MRKLLRVGLPKALIHYKFETMWKVFFQELGAEVIISSETTKKIRDLAVRSAPDEDCYSTKIYHGHILELKNQVDYLFIPRFGSRHKTDMGCPKFIALVDVLRSIYPDLPKLISPHLNVAKYGHNKIYFFKEVLKVGFIFTKNPFRIINAMRKALKADKLYKKKLIIDNDTLHKWERSEILLNKTPNEIPREKSLKIALVGHSYVINDNYCSLDIRKKLQEYDVDLITSEQMPRGLIDEQLDKLENRLYFEFEREILGTIMYFLENKTVDGIIQLMIFSCGPDSLAGELASIFAKRQKEVQLLQIVFDDLTAEAGMRTRIEAFIDMLKRRKEKTAYHIPTLRIT
ncbi:MAG TPA: acyl-CoA dehydratase activase-related protein [Candidatus Bathyarchaeia archaeon]|nr:acyl-CoA dehydratase activase-related protein [Candidatus Bathyarchaeia archaeon]